MISLQTKDPEISFKVKAENTPSFKLFQGLRTKKKKKEKVNYDKIPYFARIINIEIGKFEFGG